MTLVRGLERRALADLSDDASALWCVAARPERMVSFNFHWRSILDLGGVLEAITLKYPPTHVEVMTEIALIWDRPLLFEKLFVEYGFACERVSPLQIGTAYAPKFDVAILPVGFGNPAYSTVAKSAKSLGTPLREFVRKGGSLVAFSPYLDDYDFSWLGLSCRFRLLARDEIVKIVMKREHPAAQIVDVLEAHTDGYLTGASEHDVVMEADYGAVLTVTVSDKGRFILSTIHEFPARRFIAWALESAQA